MYFFQHFGSSIPPNHNNGQGNNGDGDGNVMSKTIRYSFLSYIVFHQAREMNKLFFSRSVIGDSAKCTSYRP